MRRLITKVILTLVFGLLCHTVNAQTFKITDLETSNERHYQQIAKEALGATILIVFYDNTVSITLKGEGKPFILKRVKEDMYSMSERTGDSNTNYQIHFSRLKGKITMLRFTSVNSNNRMVFIARKIK